VTTEGNAISPTSSTPQKLLASTKNTNSFIKGYKKSPNNSTENGSIFNSFSKNSPINSAIPSAEREEEPCSILLTLKKKKLSL
jgi:hypothetical protein